jgi:hypothetical protein
VSRFPQHVENVKVARCSDCRLVVPLVAWWGPKQERGLCMPCDDRAWEALLASTGRLDEWLRMVYGRTA